MKILVCEAAEYLECSPTRVLGLLRTGVLPGVKLGQSWVIPRAAFYEAVAALAVSRAGVASSAPLHVVSALRRGAGQRLPRSVEPFSQV